MSTEIIFDYNRDHDFCLCYTDYQHHDNTMEHTPPLDYRAEAVQCDTVLT
jgi:hypothetical protein